MAITNIGGGDSRLEVTTAAVGESLGSQTQQTGSNTIILSDTFDNLANSDTEAAIDYVDRLILIRKGLATEEVKRIIADAAGSGTTRILTVHEDWTVVPASSDDCQVSYVMEDMDTTAPVALLQKRVHDYGTSKRIQIGDNTNFAWLAIIDGRSQETNDNNSTTEADYTIRNPARLDVGYLFAGQPVSGSYIISTPATDGELSIEVQDGGVLTMYDFFHQGVANLESRWNDDGTNGSVIRGNKIKWLFNCREFDMLIQNMQITDLTIEGQGTTSDIIRCRDYDANAFIKGLTIINTNGITTRNADTSTETIEFRNVLFINNLRLIEVNSNKTWDIVNPVWSPTLSDETDFNFLTGTSNIINEKFSLDTTSKRVDGTALTAKVYVVEEDNGSGSQNMPHELTADANGLANVDVTKRGFTETGGGGSIDAAVHATFSVLSFEYGDLPVITAYTPNNTDVTTGQFGNIVTFAHLDDIFQVEGTAATARTLGDTTNDVKIQNQANPATLIKFTGGSGVNPTVGDTIGNSVDGAQGTFRSLVEGNFVAGTMLLDARDATAWPTAAHNLDDAASGGDWVAAFDTGFGVKSFTWLIDADILTSQQLYDYLNAKADEATLDKLTPTFFDTILNWANEGTNALPVVGVSTGSPNTFKTVSETIKNEGWMVYDSDGTDGAPNLVGWVSFQSDDDSLFTPESTVTLTVHCERKDDNTDIQSVQVIIIRVSDSTTITSGTTNASGDFTDSFVYTADVDVIIRARKSTLPIPRFFPEDAANTIKTTGMTQNFLLVEDSIVAQA